MTSLLIEVKIMVVRTVLSRDNRILLPSLKPPFLLPPRLFVLLRVALGLARIPNLRIEPKREATTSLVGLILEARDLLLVQTPA